MFHKDNLLTLNSLKLNQTPLPCKYPGLLLLTVVHCILCFSLLCCNVFACILGRKKVWVFFFFFFWAVSLAGLPMMSLEHDSSCFTCLYIIEKGKGKNQKKKNLDDLSNMECYPSAKLLKAHSSAECDHASGCIAMCFDIQGVLHIFYVLLSAIFCMTVAREGFSIERFFFSVGCNKFG